MDYYVPKNALPSPREYPVLLPEGSAETVERVKQQDPQLFEMCEQDLWEYLRAKDQAPDATVGALRLRFWEEWRRAEGQQMKINNICRGICLEKTWFNAIRNVYSLAWILCCPSDITAKYQEKLDVLSRNLRYICNLPVNSTGKADMALARLQFEMLRYFDARLNGAIVQKVEQKTTAIQANVSAEATPEQVMQLLKSLPPDQLVALLADMRSKAFSSSPAPEPLPAIEVKHE